MHSLQTGVDLSTEGFRPGAKNNAPPNHVRTVGYARNSVTKLRTFILSVINLKKEINWGLPSLLKINKDKTGGINVSFLQQSVIK